MRQTFQGQAAEGSRITDRAIKIAAEGLASKSAIAAVFTKQACVVALKIEELDFGDLQGAAEIRKHALKIAAALPLVRSAWSKDERTLEGDRAIEDATKLLTEELVRWIDGLDALNGKI